MTRLTGSFDKEAPLALPRLPPGKEDLACYEYLHTYLRPQRNAILVILSAVSIRELAVGSETARINTIYITMPT